MTQVAAFTGVSGLDLGHFTDRVAILDPTATDVPAAFEVSAAASTAEADCGPRLDVGTPYKYEFSNVSVERSNIDGNIYLVNFGAQWAGAGQAGAVTCEFRVVGADGAILATDSANLLLLDGIAKGLLIPGDVQYSGGRTAERR